MGGFTMTSKRHPLFLYVKIFLLNEKSEPQQKFSNNQYKLQIYNVIFRNNRRNSVPDVSMKPNNVRGVLQLLSNLLTTILLSLVSQCLKSSTSTSFTELIINSRSL